VPGSFRVARVLGIDIRIHISWLLIFFLVLLSLADQVFPASYPQWSASRASATTWSTGWKARLIANRMPQTRTNFSPSTSVSV